MTRACALNLIVVCEEMSSPREFARLMAAITAEHPCRVFQLLLEPDAKDPLLKAEVSAHCHRPAGTDRQVCCEQITLTAKGQATTNLNGVVTPLLVSDLPVFLWWRGEPPLEEKRYRRLVDLAHRVIIDTRLDGRSVDVLAAFSGWWRESRASRWGAAPGDLNWRRLYGWREMVSSLFDAPDRRPALRNITRFELSPGTSAAGEEMVSAFYLCGWLAAQLDWQIRPATARRVGGRFRFELDAHTHVIKVSMAFSEEAEVPLGLELQSEWDEGSLFLEGKAVAGRNVIACRILENSGPAAKREADLGEADPALLMRRELEVGGRDAVYERTLDLAGTLARLWLELDPGGMK
ncbi:MAG: glucose-6-phosphate dehydrogenase assembly protein OpcA [Acidobacteriota bacterium]